MDLLTDRLGRLVARCYSCERRLAGICRDCNGPVEGQTGKATRCAGHKQAARVRQQRESERRHREERLARARKYSKRKAVRARKYETRKAWAEAHPDRVKMHKRRYALKQTPGYVANYRRHNARPERIAQKRAQALQKYYELHPTRPAPVCRICGASIPFSGLGRPRATCGSRGKCANAPSPARRPPAVMT
ncbi:MAG: hypothetical protein H7099_11670 [Gemmatimonadaceae bacterium]|nr:hypothetical protein [Gemmatimonadaceae bacterium]